MVGRTNILLITSDQQHWNTLGCINPKIKLDLLARFNWLDSLQACLGLAGASGFTGELSSQHLLIQMSRADGHG